MYGDRNCGVEDDALKVTNKRASISTPTVNRQKFLGCHFFMHHRNFTVGEKDEYSLQFVSYRYVSDR
jgi:hypothetical protein